MALRVRTPSGMALSRVRDAAHLTELTGEARQAGQTVQAESAAVLHRSPAPLQVLLGSFRGFGEHADGVHAGAMAFFGLLSMFPLVLLTIVLFSRFIRSDAAANLILSQVGAMLPDAGPVANATSTTLDLQPAALGASLFTLLWSSLGVFVTLGYALDRAWGQKGDRNIVLQYLIAAGLSLAVGASGMTASLLA